MKRIEKILITTDLSPCSEEALAYAAFLAGQLDATILLTHILEPLGYPIDFAMIQSDDFEQWNRGKALEQAAALWRQKGLRIETHFFRGDPATEIVKAAQNLECDLIVMGTHGRTGITHLVMGSVAEKVVRISPIPVLTVRQQKIKETVPLPEEKEAISIRPQHGWGIMI